MSAPTNSDAHARLESELALAEDTNNQQAAEVIRAELRKLESYDAWKLLESENLRLRGDCDALLALVQRLTEARNATDPSHAALVAEVTALRATLGDAVELCESLRADRDALVKTAAEFAGDTVIMTVQRDALRAACESVLRGLELSPIAGMETDAAMLRAALERSAP